MLAFVGDLLAMTRHHQKFRTHNKTTTEDIQVLCSYVFSLFEGCIMFENLF